MNGPTYPYKTRPCHLGHPPFPVDAQGNGRCPACDHEEDLRRFRAQDAVGRRIKATGTSGPQRTGPEPEEAPHVRTAPLRRRDPRWWESVDDARRAIREELGEDPVED